MSFRSHKMPHPQPPINPFYNIFCSNTFFSFSSGDEARESDSNRKYENVPGDEHSDANSSVKRAELNLLKHDAKVQQTPKAS